ncbi:Os02g0304701 [Oryza sativa Japonica Group]|uniref:Os02g0304701 protein n=1 Tax=Oryza sativa subsp. japonica TaxID=39947 RepID=A0A0P0VI13_ORYSJ|nr:Os02g0304701 [Oryza sativa Japonica Group]
MNSHACNYPFNHCFVNSCEGCAALRRSLSRTTSSRRSTAAITAARRRRTAPSRSCTGRSGSRPSPLPASRRSSRSTAAAAGARPRRSRRWAWGTRGRASSSSPWAGARGSLRLLRQGDAGPSSTSVGAALRVRARWGPGGG